MTYYHDQSSFLRMCYSDDTPNNVFASALLLKAVSSRAQLALPRRCDVLYFLFSTPVNEHNNSSVACGAVCRVCVLIGVLAMISDTGYQQWRVATVGVLIN